jgi:hypothetical protein
MPYPTVAQIQTDFGILLDDPNQVRFTPALFTVGFQQAFDSLFNTLLNSQAPILQIIVNASSPVIGANMIIAPNTLSFNPVAAGIVDMADYVRLEERTANSTEKFTDMTSWDQLPQRSATDRLIDYVFRLDTFFFVGATIARELQLTYDSAGIAPASGSIMVDGSRTFLAKASAAAVGGILGLDELAARYRIEAYGSRYDQTGVPGGELLRIVAPRVRSEQHTPMAIKPYSVYRSRLKRRVPYVVAQQGQGVGRPTQFSSAFGTVTGAINGSNLVFLIPNAANTIDVYRNGLLMTAGGIDYTFLGGNQFTFVVAQTPQVGDIITVDAWLI